MIFQDSMIAVVFSRSDMFFWFYTTHYFGPESRMVASPSLARAAEINQEFLSVAFWEASRLFARYLHEGLSFTQAWRLEFSRVEGRSGGFFLVARMEVVLVLVIAWRVALGGAISMGFARQCRAAMDVRLYLEVSMRDRMGRPVLYNMYTYPTVVLVGMR